VKFLEKKVILATGRRKTSVARVRLVVPGNGRRMVNGKQLRDYLQREDLIVHALKPIEVAKVNGKMDVICKAEGGGITGQAGAIRLGIARALASYDENLKKLLKDQGLLTRDPRMVERKKYGQIKARKRFQYSKR
jgi:small subunit ribosomal protein S9